MNRLPALSAERIVGALQRAGFEVARQKGSHVFLQHADGRTTVVPVHRGEDVDRGLLRKILKDANLSREEFLGLLERGRRQPS